MGFVELFLLAIGLSMDAFAVAISIGLTLPRFSLKHSVIVGLYFGIFQAVMPLIGFGVAALFADRIIAYDHWIAFGLLCFLGVKMIFGSTEEEDEPDDEVSLSPAKLLPLAVATSIDALAVGVSLAFLHIDIVPAVAFIGSVTFSLSMLGVRIGSIFGMRFKSRAELLGGAILVLIGLGILLEHMGVINL